MAGAGAAFLDKNKQVLQHIFSMGAEDLRAGVRSSLFPALASAGWRIDDAIEAIWRGEPVPAAGARDPASAHVVAGLGVLVGVPVPALPDHQDELAFAFSRNPHSAARAATEGRGADGIDYRHSRGFWTGQPPTLAGMLGGADETHEPDIAGSLRFLAALGFANDVPDGRALDCGAGIGRVARHVLLRRFDVVDLLEQDGRFLEQARRELPAERVGACICAPLQEALLLPPDQPAGAEPSGPRGSYQLVWAQWVLNYLADEDLVAFLRRAAAALDRASPRRFVVVKETHVREGAPPWLDEADAGLTRSREGFEALFARAGLGVHAQELERDMPRGLLPVRMWALVPLGEQAEPARA